MPKGQRYIVPKTPEQVLRRIMNDFLSLEEDARRYLRLTENSLNIRM